MVRIDNNMAIKGIFLNEWLVLVFDNDNHGTKTGISRNGHLNRCGFFKLGMMD